MDNSPRPQGTHPSAQPCPHPVPDLDVTGLPAVLDPAALKRLEAFLEARPEIVLTFATGRGGGDPARAVAARNPGVAAAAPPGLGLGMTGRGCRRGRHQRLASAPPAEA